MQTWVMSSRHALPGHVENSPSAQVMLEQYLLSDDSCQAGGGGWGGIFLLNGQDAS